tara:strand:- start:82 stop:288 length:207 start_codon:yes stop_codon:yes gene_type:complete
MKKFDKNIIKSLENSIKNVTELLDEVINIDMDSSDKIFKKKTDILNNKAKNLEKNLKDEYKDYLDTKK